MSTWEKQMYSLLNDWNKIGESNNQNPTWKKIPNAILRGEQTFWDRDNTDCCFYDSFLYDAAWVKFFVMLGAQYGL